MQALRVRHLVVVLVGVAVAAAGCGSSSSSQSPAQATSQITATWESFFSSSGTANQIQGMNPQLHTVYARAVSTLFPKGLSSKVHSVTLLSSSECQSNGIPAPCAKVTYDLDAKGSTLLPNANGYATRAGGTWYVSKNTFCALLALSSGGTPPAGC
jgi:hypothetical protein